MQIEKEFDIFKIIKYVFFVVIIIFLIIIIYQTILITNEQKNLKALELEQAEGEKLIDYYNKQLENLSDSEYYKKYLDEVAREKLNLVKEDEIVIVGK